MAETIRSLGVIGAGTMGPGIAQTAILAGIATTLVDVDAGALERGQKTIEGGLARLVGRERLSAADRDAALARLTTAGSVDDLSDVEGVIEAVTERVELKQTIFQRLESVCGGAKFLASNTSSLSVQEIAAKMADRSRVLGLHYFNPPQVLNLVEVVAPLTVSAEALAAARAYVEATGKTAVRAKDTPAFIVNRLFVPFALDAMRLLESGVASAEDIDKACQLGLGHNMGPLATSDLVGLDVMLHVAESMHREIPGDPAVAPPTLLRRLVDAGRLGRKSGKGIFEYE